MYSGRTTLRPSWRRTGVVVGAALLLGLVALETALRLLPRRPASALANAVYTAYGSFPGGIYVTEPETGINFMVPELTTENFWNGYRWRHATDELGFRNPPGLADRSLVLLGDSLVYGHGVDEAETVAAILRGVHGRPAYNMARQGDCLYEHYVLLRLYGDELRPRDAVLFVFLNDVRDLLSHAEDGRLPGLERDWRALRRRVAELGARPEYPLRRQAYRLRSLRLLRGLLGLFAGDWLARAEAGPGPTSGDALAAAVLDERSFALAAGFYRRALARLEPTLAAAGTRLRVVLLDVGAVAGPDGVAASARLEDLLASLGRDGGFPFTTTRGLFDSCAECFLPRDGHLAPAGHARLARFVDAQLAAPGR